MRPTCSNTVAVQLKHQDDLTCMDKTACSQSGEM